VFKAFYSQDGEEHVHERNQPFYENHGRGFILMVSLNQSVKRVCKPIRARTRYALCGSGKKFKRCCGAE